MPTDAHWEERYLSGDMPWEKGSGAPGLEDFLACHPDLPRGQVLVPGCGTGHDARTWARHGFRVWGLDLAPSAIRLADDRTRSAGLQAEFRRADFLHDDPWTTVDWIFEHTLYCAIDPSLRDAYAAAVLRWLKPGGSFLAVHYMIDDAEGPPYGCRQSELMERFGRDLDLHEGWIPRSYPNRTGLELMLWWTRPLPGAPRHPPVPRRGAVSFPSSAGAESPTPSASMTAAPSTPSPTDPGPLPGAGAPR